ncbi:MAG: PBP1A family penicillin-binding protein [Candidatus Glassbacteria bacterium]|nr:PBP1A family penicillin-binding protein [Candidatus Glassbacteria bacterium]
MIIIKLIKALFYLAVCAVVVGFCLGVVIVATMGRDLPQLPDKLEKLVLNTQTEFYANTGRLLATMGEKNRVPIGRISRNFVSALLAAEDADFYDHPGISKKGILRAVWLNLRSGRIESGASTITQQLARNFFLSLEQTRARKLKEILMALQLEYSFDKDEILEAYCNNMYYGSGAYGVEAASRVYFARHADQLSLAQAALLVAILNGPSVYNPYSHPGRARARQLWILRRMEELEMVSGTQRLDAENEELSLKRYTETTGRSSYFLDYVQERIRERFGEEFLYYGGLRVHTTLDERCQAAAVSAVRSQLKRLDNMLGLPEYELQSDTLSRQNYLQGALAAVEAGTGAILAMVGGRDYDASQFNRAVQSNRLPGSAFKPFVYYTALRDLGLSPATTLVDSQVSYQLPNGDTWTPGNFEQDFLGRMTLKKALEKSRNVIAAQLIEMTGPEEVVATARRFGITGDLPPTPSLALGTGGVSPVEMAAAFAVFAAAGTYYQPYAITRIEDTRGNILDDYIARGRDVANPQVVYQVVDMMRQVVNQGTGAVVRRMGFSLPAAGKTGTTSDYRDSWFVGFTPGISAACWVGFDDNREIRFEQNGRMVGLTGSRGGAPMWAMFLSKVSEGKPRQDFPIPPGLEFIEIDGWTGLPVPREPAPGTDSFAVPLLPEQFEVLRQKGALPDTASYTPAFDPLDF